MKRNDNEKIVCHVNATLKPLESIWNIIIHQFVFKSFIC